MVDQPAPHGDFAEWSAGRWAELVPQADSTAAAVAIRFIRVANDLSQSQARTIRPWRRQGVNTVDDFRTLSLLRHVGSAGIRIQYIAEHLRNETSTVSSRVARLEKRGLLERIDDPVDRRANQVRLLPGVETMVDDIYLALVANHERFFGGLTAEEHETLAEFLGRL